MLITSATSINPITAFNMQLEILHDSTYTYVGQVETVRHQAHLKPRSNMYQNILFSNIQIEPTPDVYYETQDIFGNFSSYFSIQEKHPTLVIQSRSRVETFSNANHQPLEKIPSWENVREYFKYSTLQKWDSASEFLFNSPLIQYDAQYVKFAKEAFFPQRNILEGAIALMEQIYHQFEYQTKSTNINTPTREAFDQKKGVCQDFAHIFISCMRSIGLPAKYISGYLLTTPPPGKVRLIGADASHAWTSVYIPSFDLYNQLSSGVWCDFDPTNNRWGIGSPGEDYVFLAQGRDYADVSPIRGVIKGSANHDIKVSVTVRPTQTD